MREAEARHHVVGLQSLQRGQEDPLHDTVKVKPKLYLKSQDTGDARTLGHPPRRKGNSSVGWPRRESLCVGGGGGGRAIEVGLSKPFGAQNITLWTSDVGPGTTGFVFALLDFAFALV